MLIHIALLYLLNTTWSFKIYQVPSLVTVHYDSYLRWVIVFMIHTSDEWLSFHIRVKKCNFCIICTCTCTPGAGWKCCKRQQENTNQPTALAAGHHQRRITQQTFERRHHITVLDIFKIYQVPSLVTVHYDSYLRWVIVFMIHTSDEWLSFHIRVKKCNFCIICTCHR